MTSASVRAMRNHKLWNQTGSDLEAIVAFVEDSRRSYHAPTPWEENHEVSLIGWGGIYSRETRRVTIAERVYRSRVSGNRVEEIAGDVTYEFDKDVVFDIGAEGSDANASGREGYHVGGNMDWHFHAKNTRGRLHINKTWHGPIKRMIGLEGVICGGAFAKTYMGLSVTMGAMVMGDVYGGCVRASGARVHIAGLNYRSTELTAWAAGAYVRLASSVFEPLAGSASGNPKRSRTRNGLTAAARIGLATCPAFEILAGLAGFLVAIIAMIARAIALKAGWKPKPKPPPEMEPRTLNRTVGAIVCSRNSEVTA